MSRKYSDDQIFIKNPKCSEGVVKKRFVERVQYECSICFIDKWKDLPLTLQMDHIDGDHNNNEFSNLRLLCPNCHAQTDTYAGKNLYNKKNVTDEQLIEAIEKSICVAHALKLVGLDIGRTEYFGRAHKLIADGKATLNKTTFDDVF